MPRLVRTHVPACLLYNEKYPVMKMKHNSIATYGLRTYKRNADPLERWPIPTNNNHFWSVSTTGTRKAGLTVQKPTNSHGCHHTILLPDTVRLHVDLIVPYCYVCSTHVLHVTRKSVLGWLAKFQGRNKQLRTNKDDFFDIMRVPPRNLRC